MNKTKEIIIRRDWLEQLATIGKEFKKDIEGVEIPFNIHPKIHYLLGYIASIEDILEK